MNLRILITLNIIVTILLILRHRFKQSGRFNMLIYRSDPIRKKCSEPTKLENECTIM